MKVSGYVTAVEQWKTSTNKDKVSVVLDNGEKKYPFWVNQRGKPDFIPPKVGDYIDLEYTDDGKYINGVEWALQRQEPIKESAHAQQGQADKWATLPAKEHLVARENATKNATALVVAKIQAGLLKDGIEQELEHWFQISLQLLFQGTTAWGGDKTELDIAMEAALAWAENNNIHPDKLDKFVGAYRVSHNLTTLEVLTLLNSGHFDPGVVELAGE